MQLFTVARLTEVARQALILIHKKEHSFFLYTCQCSNETTTTTLPALSKILRVKFPSKSRTTTRIRVIFLSYKVDSESLGEYFHLKFKNESDVLRCHRCARSP